MTLKHVFIIWISFLGPTINTNGEIGMWSIKVKEKRKKKKPSLLNTHRKCQHERDDSQSDSTAKIDGGELESPIRKPHPWSVVMKNAHHKNDHHEVLPKFTNLYSCHACNGMGLSTASRQTWWGGCRCCCFCFFFFFTTNLNVHVSYGVTWAIEFPSESVEKQRPTSLNLMSAYMYAKLLPHAKPMTSRGGTTAGCGKVSRGDGTRLMIITTIITTRSIYYTMKLYIPQTCQVRCPAFQVTPVGPLMHRLFKSNIQH